MTFLVTAAVWRRGRGGGGQFCPLPSLPRFQDSRSSHVSLCPLPLDTSAAAECGEGGTVGAVREGGGGGGGHDGGGEGAILLGPGRPGLETLP